MITSDKVISLAREMVGTPYRHQGRTRSAVDCIGLVVVIIRELEIVDPSKWIPANYSSRPRDGLLESYVRDICEEISTPVEGCMALFRWARTAPPAHCALLTPQTMIHSYKTVGAVVEHGFGAKWPSRAFGFYKLPGVDYGR